MGDVRRLWIEGPAGKLEAALRVSGQCRGAVVLTHPHPLYGGTLGNPVVFHADRELNRRGLTTLRFNFRGVEASDGSHDEGRGEVGDVAAAALWVRALAPGRPLILAGYSFGSRVSVTHAISNAAIAGVVAIGLPVRLWPFDDLVALGRPLAVVQGTADEFGPIQEVEAAIARASPAGRLYPVPEVSHRFSGRAPDVGSLVADAVDWILQGLGGSAS